MIRYLQLHGLIVLPVSNPNRDDMGAPKSAIYGGVPRLRLSSQSLKRAMRFSPVFQNALQTYCGKRTKRVAEWVRQELDDKLGSNAAHQEVAAAIARVWGKPDNKRDGTDGHPVVNATLAFISPQEMDAMISIAETHLQAGDECLIEILKLRTKKRSKAEEGQLTQALKRLGERIMHKSDSAVDIGMFGRMLADAPVYNREAAVQVSHAITTHKAHQETDYWTGVDDMNTAEDTGAGHLDTAYFGSGVFYIYACINRELLLDNLADNRELMHLALTSFTKAFAMSLPSGKINSFAHHARASYLQASLTNEPFSLQGAFFQPVRGNDLLGASITALETWQAQAARVYGTEERSLCMNMLEDDSATLEDLRQFAISEQS